MKFHLFPLLSLLGLPLFTHCGKSELSSNEKLSQKSLREELKSFEREPVPVAAAALPANWMSDPTKVTDKPVSGAEDAVLTDAPNVPPPITRDHPTKVTIKLEVVELVKRMADGVDYTFWTLTRPRHRAGVHFRHPHANQPGRRCLPPPDDEPEVLVA